MEMSFQLTRETVEPLFQQLLLHSHDLEKAVLKEETEPEEWLELLDKREEVLGQIADAIDRGFVLPPEWNLQYATPFLEIDQRLLPVMQEKQDELSEKINQIQRGRTANKQYGGYSGSPAYGAFFDTKK